MPDPQKTTFENINDLLKAVLWPIVVVIVLTSYHSDISNMFQNTEKMSIGSFSMEIKREAESQGSGELSGVITQLSIPGIKHLLSMGAIGRYGIVGRSPAQGDHEAAYTLSPDLTSWEELEKAGLIAGSNFKIEDAVKLFMQLGAEQRQVYYDDEGTSVPFNDAAHMHKGTQYFLPVSRVNDATKQQVENYTIALTDNGRKALDIIVATTARQIKVTKTN